MFEKLTTWFDERPPRERKLLLAMIATFFVLGALVVTLESIKRFGQKSTEIAELREALDYLYNGQEAYLNEKARLVAMDQKLEDGSRFSATDFLTKKAQEHGIQIQTNQQGTRALSAEANSDTVEQEIRVETTQSTDYRSLMRLLVSISESDAPVFVRILTIKRANRQPRRGGGEDDEEGAKIDIDMVVSTFIPKEDAPPE